MAKIKYIEHNGKSHTIDVANGLSVMEGAVQNNIPGIDADCGGECSCGTCHINLSQYWFDKLEPLSEREEEMLSMNPERTATSRLACQISVEERMDQIIVLIPEYQF